MHLSNSSRTAHEPSRRAQLPSPDLHAAGLAETLRPRNVVGFQPELVKEISPFRLTTTEDVEPKKRSATIASRTSTGAAGRIPAASTITAMWGASWGDAVSMLPAVEALESLFA